MMYSMAPVAVVEGQRKQALEQTRARLIFCLFMMGTLFMLLAGRLMDLGVSSVYYEGRTATEQTPTIPASLVLQRADITDRNGILLATNLSTQSLYANPRVMIDKEDAVKKIAKLFPELKTSFLKARFNTDKSFVWIKRNLTPKEQVAVMNLGIPGLNFQNEERRIYPQGELFAHVLGYVGTEGHGLAGIEKTFDEQLLTKSKPVKLTVDVRVQNALKTELENTIAKFNAIGAAAMVMDVNNGEIVGLISLPDYNLNRFTASSENVLFNRALSGVYEMGSTMKAVTLAMALDSGRVHMSDSYDATNPIRVGRFAIEDFHAKRRVLSVPEVFMYSSNIGTAKMALDVGAEGQQKFFKKAGLLKPITLELPEKPQPIYPKEWSKTSAMTIAFGHGIAVSPLHVISVLSGLANGGVLHQPTLIRHETPLDSTRIIKEKTSDAVRRLLRLVVTHGSGRGANVPGYLVGGKTGTAEKLGGTGYSKDARLSSFVGVFPVHAPRYAVLVMIDEPKGIAETGGYATGGAVAAPAAGRIITQIAPMLGVAPVDENAPEIREATYINPALTEPKLASAQ